jgi:integrase/recombinase XerD
MTFPINLSRLCWQRDWRCERSTAISVVLKEFFKFLASEGWLNTNIAAELKPFKVKPSLTHTFTDGHLQRLFAQPDRSTFTGYRNYVMMLVLLDTGIRLKELANLRVTDIDFEEQSLRIQQGKGRKSRIVPIQRTCAWELKYYLQERGKLEHDYLWVNLDNEPFNASGIRTMIDRYCRAADIRDVQCSCHTFRHTMAYIELFSRDLQIQHEKFSPVEHFPKLLVLSQIFLETILLFCYQLIILP